MRKQRSGGMPLQLKYDHSKCLHLLNTNPTFVLRELVMDVMQEKLKGQFSELEAGKGKQ